MSSATNTAKNRVVLVSIDGYGLSVEQKGNAVYAAKKPTLDELTHQHLATKIDASGLAVGLPEGIMGNSEVGHLTMGAGRVQFQDLVRITKSVTEKTLSQNETLQKAFSDAGSSSGRLHFLGLISDGAVHSHIEHLFALLEAAKAAGIPQAFVHFFADGRDTPPTSAVKYLKEVQEYLKKLEYGILSTVQGRYYAMDRDKRWERIEIAYKALTGAVGHPVSNDHLIQYVEDRYNQKENDEFLKPIIVDSHGTIQDSDTLVFFNFRSDRMRQIVSVFGDTLHPSPFKYEPKRNNLKIYQMTQYDINFPFPILFPPINMHNGLAECVSKAGWKQFHCAETEKYAHVTFFFNGGIEKQYAGEERKLIPSPKVATYDLQPEMSMDAVAHAVAEAIASNQYQFIMNNFAAPDMVGHTGVYDKTVIAVEACDAAIKVIWDACRKHGYVLVITSDHGNAEEMLDEHDKPKTSHTTNLIPLIIAHPNGESNHSILLTEEASTLKAANKPVGGLACVAPTCLALLGLAAPAEISGKSIIKPL